MFDWFLSPGRTSSRDDVPASAWSFGTQVHRLIVNNAQALKVWIDRQIQARGRAVLSIRFGRASFSEGTNS